MSDKKCDLLRYAALSKKKRSGYMKSHFILRNSSKKTYDLSSDKIGSLPHSAQFRYKHDMARLTLKSENESLFFCPCCYILNEVSILWNCVTLLFLLQFLKIVQDSWLISARNLCSTSTLWLFLRKGFNIIRR